MGATTLIRTKEACSVDELREWFEDELSEMAFESGCVYSGTWTSKDNSFVVRNEKPISAEAADKLIHENDKWGPCDAIRVAGSLDNDSGKPGSPLIKKLSKLIEKKREDIVKLDGRIMGWIHHAATEEKGSDGSVRLVRNSHFRPAPKDFLVRIKAGKSKFRTCGECGSKISVEHLHDSPCPVCKNGYGLMSNTDIMKVETIITKAIEAKQAIHDAEVQINLELERLAKETSSWYWLVGGWCPE